jgi:porin
VFYRFHLTEHLALTPDVQLVCNPALNPSEDFVWALGFRMRVAF